MTRKVTNELLEMAEGGSLTWEMIARAALSHMSEREVADMAHSNELVVEEDEQDDGGNYDSHGEPVTCTEYWDNYQD
jgi:hypothetical protein